MRAISLCFRGIALAWLLPALALAQPGAPLADRYVLAKQTDGSDKRGTIFGLYDLSQQMGVSPWAWWADVPVPPKRTSTWPPAAIPWVSPR